MKAKTKNYILLTIYFLSLTFGLECLTKSFAEEEKTIDPKKEEFEKTAKTDSSNLNYYPKLNLGNSNLFTGATTLKGNEVFARLGVNTIIPTGYWNENGVLEKKDQAISLTPTLTLAWGIIDNLFFSASVPYKFYLTGTNGISDPWISIKYKFWDDPINLAFQIESKIPVGDSLQTYPFGDGQTDVGGMILATKFFDPIYFQSGLGYKYKFSKANKDGTVIKPTDNLSYVLNVGSNLSSLSNFFPEYTFFDNLMFDFSFYGYIPVASGTKTGNILSITPNLTYKFSNMDINLSYHQTLLGNSVDRYSGIFAGVTFKESFKYPKIFELILAPKIDKETLDDVNTSSVNQKGKMAFVENCSKCHLLVDPKAYKIEDWQMIVDKYKEKKLISNKEYNRIIEYLNDYIETSSIKKNTKEIEN